MNEGLKSQLKERSKVLDNLAKQEKELNASTGFKFSCDHGGNMYSCSICFRMYPKKMLSKNVFKMCVEKYLKENKH